MSIFYGKVAKESACLFVLEGHLELYVGKGFDKLLNSSSIINKNGLLQGKFSIDMLNNKF